MTKLAPYLSFHGQCAEAFAFYAKTLGGHVTMQMRYADGPHPFEEVDRDRIMHAAIQLDGQTIMGADMPSTHAHEKASGFSLMIEMPTVEAAHATFSELSEGGRVTMPMAETFWTKAFGMAVDRFGIPWSVNGPMQAG